MAIDALIHEASAHPLQYLLLSAIVLPVSYLLANEFIRQQARILGLAGPKGLPIVGNLWEIRVNAAEKYRQWARKYGDVYQIQLGNIPVVVVLSNTAGTTIGTSPYSESLKGRRKGAASALNKPSIQTYVPHLDVESKDFISELLRYGQAGALAIDPMPMIQRLSLSLALTINWGIRIDSQEDALFEEITHVEDEVSRFRSTTGNLQDYIPMLRLNPFNFGSKKARETRSRRDVYLKSLNKKLEDRMQKGTHQPCIQANMTLDEDAKLNNEELTSISLTMLSGGLDTITTQLQWSIALLSQWPDIQQKAWKEIAEFYAEDKPLCDALDDQKCPYIVALVRECLRYFTVLRLALPRVSIKDIAYGGAVVLAGTAFFLNAWACNMDETIWSDPNEFRPERWIEQPNAPMFTYGLGYRMCAGSLLANRELYLVILRMLNAFEIQVTDSVDCHPDTSVSDPTSLVSMPKKYTTKFQPRNLNALEMAIEEFQVVDAS